jgi:hypothetical protein
MTGSNQQDVTGLHTEGRHRQGFVEVGRRDGVSGIQSVIGSEGADQIEEYASTYEVTVNFVDS